MALSKYSAALLKDLPDNMATFSSTELLTGAELESYQVPMPMKAGARMFKRKSDRDGWVNNMNAQHGAGTAAILPNNY